jgi:hypothetical protein
VSITLPQDGLIYDAVMRLMDQVEAVDKKVSRLLSAAGIEEASAGLTEAGRPDG